MNWSRCSSVVAIAVLLVLVATLAAGPALAVSPSDEGVPGEAQVGSEVTATFTFTDLYTDYESWTLHGETNLTGVTWTVRTLDQAGNQVSQQSFDGGSFDADVALEDDVAEVVVRVTGTAPEVDSFSYDPRQQFTLAAFDLVREGGTSRDIETWSVAHYTEASQAARDDIDAAETAVDDAGGAGGDDLDRAIQAYEAGNFELASSLAADAESAAQGARQSRQTTQLLLYGGVGVLALAVVFGGFLYWRSRQGPSDPLR
jgi:hypothetical protein